MSEKTILYYFPLHFYSSNNLNIQHCNQRMWGAVESIIAEHLFDWVWEEVEYRIMSSAK